MRDFDEIRAAKLPYVFNGDNLSKYRADEGTVNCFWSKLVLKGSGQPIARENSTLMPALENGQPIIYLLGGSPMITGQFSFEIYKINPGKQTWERINYEKPIMQTIGARPVYRYDASNDSYKIYHFSGMVPL